MFYQEHKEDVILYKGYLLKAVDGSYSEIPNTKESKTGYEKTPQNLKNLINKNYYHFWVPQCLFRTFEMYVQNAK